MLIKSNPLCNQIHLLCAPQTFSLLRQNLGIILHHKDRDQNNDAVSCNTTELVEDD